MVKKKIYITPEISRIAIDPSFILMQSSYVTPPDPRGGGSKSDSKGNDGPFQPPFSDKPFG